MSAIQLTSPSTQPTLISQEMEQALQEVVQQLTGQNRLSVRINAPSGRSVIILKMEGVLPYRYRETKNAALLRNQAEMYMTHVVDQIYPWFAAKVEQSCRRMVRSSRLHVEVNETSVACLFQLHTCDQ